MNDVLFEQQSSHIMVISASDLGFQSVFAHQNAFNCLPFSC